MVLESSKKAVNELGQEVDRISYLFRENSMTRDPHKHFIRRPDSQRGKAVPAHSPNENNRMSPFTPSNPASPIRAPSAQSSHGPTGRPQSPSGPSEPSPVKMPSLTSSH